ncbi:MAG: hypothetical protein L3K11_01230 [Thermoplasmata archaeon]|nr:hypothetical protein [Thermoplasmata archaeon]
MGAGTESLPASRAYLSGGGRGTPAVRREQSPSLWQELAPGLLAGWPFLFLGSLSLLIGILLLVHLLRLFPGSALPYWVLFSGLGIIALAGAALGAMAPEEAAPVERTRPRRAVVARPPPRPLRPIETAPDPEPVPENLSEPWMEDDEENSEPDPTVTAALFSLPYPGRTAPASYEPFGDTELPSDLPAEETGEVLAQLDQLSSLLRPVRSAHPGTSAPTVVRYCIGCERRIDPAEEPLLCTSCHGVLCAECGSASQRTGEGGKCPTCALLGEVGPDSAGSGPPF